MNKQNVWLDERIRRGLNTWLPEVPDHLDPALVQQSRSIKAEPVKSWGRRKYTPLTALAASLILGVLALWLLGPKADSPLLILNEFPKPVQSVLTAVPGQFDPAIPLPELKKNEQTDSVTLPMELKGRGDPAGNAVGKVPLQIDLQLEIPGKNITIVWCQRSDFDLFSEKIPDGRSP